jgi:hypothetical protein
MASDDSMLISAPLEPFPVAHKKGRFFMKTAFAK